LPPIWVMGLSVIGGKGNSARDHRG
jgi:hypothetical protein